MAQANGFLDGLYDSHGEVGLLRERQTKGVGVDK